MIGHVVRCCDFVVTIFALDATSMCSCEVKYKGEGRRECDKEAAKVVTLGAVLQ